MNVHSDNLVMAYGENGPELSPAGETVELPALPVGVGNKVTPATLRFLQRFREGGQPLRLDRMETRPGEHCVTAWFQTTPFVRLVDDAGPVMGNRTCCALFSLADARDALFVELPEDDRRAMGAAVAKMLAGRAAEALQQRPPGAPH